MDHVCLNLKCTVWSCDLYLVCIVLLELEVWPLGCQETQQLGSPAAFETRFGWVLAGAVDGDQEQSYVVSNHAAVLSTDDLLRRFWETEERDASSSFDYSLSADEQSVMTHFQREHRRDDSQSSRSLVLPQRSGQCSMLQRRLQLGFRSTITCWLDLLYIPP